MENSELKELREEWQSLPKYTDRQEYFLSLFEQNDQDIYERSAGLYPDIEDPEFIQKLMQKKEFQDSKQESVAKILAKGKDKCLDVEEFELSSVQKFLSRFLNPNTPYHSALVYHGVGVGKTCSAVTICESYLEQYPGRKAFIVAPPNIQAGFRRTLFDIRSMDRQDGINHHHGCTGDLYLELAGMSTEKNEQIIEKKVSKQINLRYDFFGYFSFYNYIREIKARAGAGITDEAQRRQAQFLAIRKEFSNRVIIIDEAHNLRDNVFDDEDYEDAEINSLSTDGSLKSNTNSNSNASSNNSSEKEKDLSDAAQGKQLTPELREVLKQAENISLVLMTATPMYNSYIEILFLLNLLLLNDKRPRLNVSDVFDTENESFVEGGKEILGSVVSTYVSYMRGENPLTFPHRLQPETSLRIMSWPTQSPASAPIMDTEREGVVHLPCLGCSFHPELETQYYDLSQKIVNEGGGLGITNMDTLVQAANWVYPNEDFSGDILGRIGENGFLNAFAMDGSKSKFTSLVNPQWMLEENIGMASGKARVLLERLRNSQGVQFVYSRFVRAGALSIALALEANGYLPWGHAPYLQNGKQTPGMQCALCPRKSNEHATAKHQFKQAYYILLTGSKELSPDNTAAINEARSIENANGEVIKVILGSKIAGEGLDLRFIREVYVYDSWYHLNQLEQVVGRGIRTCSHAPLPEEYRNCTITLLVTKYALPEHEALETADIYSYRLAFNKAKIMGMVTRVLKEFAIDCSLNKEAIVMKNIPPLTKCIDSQGHSRNGKDLERNDVPFSPLCDWLDDCDYGCRKADGELFTMDLTKPDFSTYDEYAARYEESRIKKELIQIFVNDEEGFKTFEDIAKIKELQNIPQTLLRSLLHEIILDPDFILHSSHGDGRIVFRNGIYLFQPLRMRRTNIPLAVRLATIPIPKDRYEPRPISDVEIQAKPILNTTQGISVWETFWNECLVWAEDMRNVRAPKYNPKDYLPDNIKKAVKSISEAFESVIEKNYIHKLEMITYLYNKLKKPNEFTLFADIMLQYIWDEFLPFQTKKGILLANYKSPLLQKIASESYKVWEKKTYLRLMDESTFELVYFCPQADGSFKECQGIFVEELNKQKDPLFVKPINNSSTGEKYGLLSFIWKPPSVVFKKAELPKGGKDLTVGQVCAASSNVAEDIRLLLELGSILRSEMHNDLGCNEVEMITVKDQDGKLTRTLNFSNSIRKCTVIDLVYRYMDAVKCNNKRWFYRIIEVKVLEHPIPADPTMKKSKKKGAAKFNDF
jgi:hypothetical protein